MAAPEKTGGQITTNADDIELRKSDFAVADSSSPPAESINAQELRFNPHLAEPVGPPATKKEVWAYYTYYAGNNGIGAFQ